MQEQKYKLAAVVVTAIIVVAVFVGGVKVINTGHRGVKTTFGKVDTEAGSIPEGIYFFNPITTNIVELDTRIQRKEGRAHTYTKDIQQSEITYVINYRLNPEAAHVIFTNVGKNWDAVLVPQAVEGVLKQVIGQYDAVDLIDSRQKATVQAQQAIADSLRPKNVIVDRFEMVNIDYTKEFEHSVEQKVVAVQKAIEEQNRTRQIEEQAKQKIIAAKAEAESIRIRAAALAQNPQLVQYEAVQKWDGKLPQYTFGNSIPLISLPK